MCLKPSNHITPSNLFPGSAKYSFYQLFVLIAYSPSIGICYQNPNNETHQYKSLSLYLRTMDVAGIRHRSTVTCPRWSIKYSV